jgi:hypothetical protein
MSTFLNQRMRRRTYDGLGRKRRQYKETSLLRQWSVQVRSVRSLMWKEEKCNHRYQRSNSTKTLLWWDWPIWPGSGGCTNLVRMPVLTANRICLISVHSWASNYEAYQFIYHCIWPRKVSRLLHATADIEKTYRWKPVLDRWRRVQSIAAIRTSPAAARALTIIERDCSGLISQDYNADECEYTLSFPSSANVWRCSL